MGVAMDVADEHRSTRRRQKLVQAFGGLDILVSNAASRLVAPLVDFEFAKVEAILSIHLDGAFLTTRAALRQMTSRRAAASSTWARSTRRKRPCSRRLTSRRSTA